MLVIGLGKRDGAAQHHRWGVRGLRDMLPETAKVDPGKDAASSPAWPCWKTPTSRRPACRWWTATSCWTSSRVCWRRRDGLMGRLPFEQLDLLVIGEIGKNYSGAGIDPNVVGRLLIEGAAGVESPRITRICCLDLSPESHGNGTGVGIADLTTDRLLAAIDPVPFRMNNLTACFLWRSKLPFAFPTDRECIETGLETCWQPNRRTAAHGSSSRTRWSWRSCGCRRRCWRRRSSSRTWRSTGELQPLPFDAAGNLRQEKLFPHSVRGRRASSSAR